MMTLAKKEFLSVFHEKILKPRKLNYVVQFTGPTGTNAVEAALKICRNVTDRQSILAFTNAFHGVTLGSLAVTGSQFYRKAAGVPLNNVFRIPYDEGHNKRGLIDRLRNSSRHKLRLYRAEFPPAVGE